MALLVVGLNHKTAPVAVRERLAFADQTLAELLAQWHGPAVEESERHHIGTPPLDRQHLSGLITRRHRRDGA